MAESISPVAWVGVADSHAGPYSFHGIEYLPVGQHELYTAAQIEQARREERERAQGDLAEAQALVHLYRDALYDGPENMSDVRAEELGRLGCDDALKAAVADAVDPWRKALADMCEEFRGHDLPYGSAAYRKANDLLYYRTGAKEGQNG